jgi:hypothetical protein
VVGIALTCARGQLEVRVDAPYHADPAPPGPPGSTDRLWEHEVVEVFVAGAQENYLELELGPHGHFLLLLLRRRREVDRQGIAVAYEAQIERGRWRGRAVVPVALLPPGPHALNAYAIHGREPGRRYLAWSPVPGPAPDFHRLECFAPVDLGA